MINAGSLKGKKEGEAKEGSHCQTESQPAPLRPCDSSRLRQVAQVKWHMLLFFFNARRGKEENIHTYMHQILRPWCQRARARTRRHVHTLSPSKTKSSRLHHITHRWQTQWNISLPLCPERHIPSRQKPNKLPSHSPCQHQPPQTWVSVPSCSSSHRVQPFQQCVAPD